MLRWIEDGVAEVGIGDENLRAVGKLEAGAVYAGEAWTRGAAALPEWQELQPMLAKRRSPFCESDMPLVDCWVHLS